MPRKPVTTLEEFTSQHAEQHRRLERYVTSGRGSDDPDSWLIEALKIGDPRSLKATSHHARIAFARAAEGLYRAPLRDGGAPLAFVTLADLCDARPLSQAEVFEIGTLKDRIRQWLDPYPFIAMIEIAYYSNWSLLGSNEPTICWHAHVLVWDVLARAMRQLLGDMNASARAFIDTRRAAHMRSLANGEAIGNLLYMLKIPLSDYRVYPVQKEMIDSETGEINTYHTGNFSQRKRALRPGDAVKAFKVLHGFELDDLSFGSGWAEELRCLSLDAARAARCREDRKLRMDFVALRGRPIVQPSHRTWLNTIFD